MARRKKTREVSCPYCGQLAVLVDGSTIHPHRHDLAERKFYLCTPCGAYVGCHKGTDRPLGRMANAELRKAKIEAHSKFDLLWKVGGFDRKGAYAWLAKKLDISKEDCHIGMMDIPMCKRVVEEVGKILGTMPVEDL